MRPLIIATVFLALGEPAVQLWMQQAFYPVLFVVLVLASLGVPIPEDVPLIAAGVILRTHPGVASWGGTLAVALVGIMIGDVILYRLGQRWGPDVFRHRWVRWLITPQRLERMSARFRRYGTWMCFFGRFVMGVRGAMCLTAGVTRFPLWRFLLADVCGALLSIPAFVWLGYWFAGMIPTVQAYVSGIQWIILVLAVAAVGGFILYELRRRRRMRANGRQTEVRHEAEQSRFQPTSGPTTPASEPAQSGPGPARTPPEWNQTRPQDTSQEQSVPVESKA
jgi:membrane protein DedA with SNARE-associated domain